MDEFLSAMDIFCLPSRFEGLPVVLIEAQAASVPCLVSSATTKESNCGGVIFKSLDDSSYDWALSIDGIIRNSENRDRSVNEKLKSFDIRLVAKNLEEFYSE